MYREICESNVAWDGELPKPLKKHWDDWSATLSEQFTIPRTLVPFLQPIKRVTLHAFGDASKNGVSAIVYAVVEQESRETKPNNPTTGVGLRPHGGKPRNQRQDGTYPLITYPPPTIHCWLDSSVALYWIRQFVFNRVQKVQQHRDVKSCRPRKSRRKYREPHIVEQWSFLVERSSKVAS